MRLFIAVPLSEEMRVSVLKTMHELKKRGVRGDYVPAQNLHMTLAVIGETKESGAAKDALRTVSFKPFKMTFDEMGNFGDLLWIGIKGNQGLSALVKEIRRALDAAGIAYDTKSFVPHVTVIRRMAGNYKGIPAPKGDRMVKQISLMKSEEKNGKRVYTEIGTF